MRDLIKTVGIRVLITLPTLLIACVLAFGLVKLTPGDPAVAFAGEYASEERVEQIREQLGLNRPPIEQLGNWLLDVARGDLGQSLFSGVSVSEMIGNALPATMHLVVGALLFAVVFGIIFGVASAAWGGNRDGIISAVATLGISIPNFWLGMILVSYFALQLQWFPAIGYVSFFESPIESIRTLILPCIALGSGPAAEITRQVRSAMLESMRSDSGRTLIAKGLTRRRIIWLHALKNAAIPIVTVTGLMVNRLLGATVVIETIFGISGMGSLVVNAVAIRDYPIIQGVVLVMALLVVVANVVMDVAYRALDPRIK